MPEAPERDPLAVETRCQCTHEAGDSECPIHPTDPETGEPTGSWMKVAELASRDADKERDQWRDAYVALRVAAKKLRDRWSEGGCITTPACGSCAWCDFEAAIDREGDASVVSAEARAERAEGLLREARLSVKENLSITTDEMRSHLPENMRTGLADVWRNDVDKLADLLARIDAHLSTESTKDVKP